MAKIKYGKVEFGPDEFADETASAVVSMMIPMTLYKELIRLSPKKEYGEEYKEFVQGILADYVQKHPENK